MIGRKSIIVLCMLSALAVCAAMAQSAVAATNGTTAFTCRNVGGGLANFNSEHCVPGSGPGNFEHIAISELTVTEATLTNAQTNETTTGALPTKLHSVVSGVEVELEATTVMGNGTMENMKAASGEHTANGTGVIEYKGVTVLKPEGKGCKVKTGEVITNKLKATTAGAGMGLKFEPNEGTVFTKFEVEGCSIGVLNGVYEVKGSVIGTPNGATTVFTRGGTTEQATLTLRGQKAGIDGKITIKAKDEEAGDKGVTTPIAATTVETP